MIRRLWRIVVHCLWPERETWRAHMTLQRDAAQEAAARLRRERLRPNPLEPRYLNARRERHHA